MKTIVLTHAIFPGISHSCIVALLGSFLAVTFAQGQSITTWRIQSSTDIEGINTEPIGSNVYRTWFTEYNRQKIGRIINQPALDAIVSEWKPDTSGQIHPFKIVTGRYNFTEKKFPTMTNVLPYSDFLSTDENVKAVPKLIEQSMKLRTFAAFTLPEEGKIGVLHQNIYGGPDYFWWYRTSAIGLNEPWDIQRRSQSYKETDAWISNRTPQQNLYQFFPLTNSFNVWNLASCQMDVRVFYVVPGRAGKNTEIWIGGRDTIQKVDYIAYVNIDGKNILKAFYKWPLTGDRTMTAICFSQSPSTRTGFTNTQVWLTSSTIPELTILEPKSLYKRGAADLLCESSSIDSLVYQYQGANGVFWAPTLNPTAADNKRRFLVSGGQNPSGHAVLVEAEGLTSVSVNRIQTSPQSSLAQVSYDVELALRSDKKVDATLNTVSTHFDTVACFTPRMVWDNTGGFSPDFSGMKLDVDINGRAGADIGSPTGFNYDVIWHEQGSGKIGRMATGPIVATMGPTVEPSAGMGDAESPDNFKLSQNYPNPFNPSTTINYILPTDAFVTLVIYNSLGQVVRTLMNNEFTETGEQSVVFNSSNLASGVYYYRLVAQSAPQNEGDEGNTRGARASAVLMDVKKMILLK